MKHKGKRILSILLSLTLTLSLVSVFNLSALATENVTTYTLQIPSTLNVANIGWNATTGLTAAVTSGDTFDSDKKLSVTAASANSWVLKDGNNSIGYNLAAATGTYSSSSTPAYWEFTAAELNASGGTNKGMGIIVDDYSSAAPGNYTDTVTFTASVANAKPEYWNKLVGCTCGNGEEEYWDEKSGFAARVVTAEQAIALAKYMAAETGRNCAVFYNGSGNNVLFAKNDGSTSSAWYRSPEEDKGLSGYNGYYVSD